MIWRVMVKSDGKWRDSGEGPFSSRSAALAFAQAEVGVPYKIVRSGKLYSGMKNPSRKKKMTKLQRMNVASKRSKQKRVAKALRAYFDAEYGKGKVTEVRVRKNPSGSRTLIPVRRRRTR